MAFTSSHFRKTIRWTLKGSLGVAGHFLLDGIPPRPCVEDLRVEKLDLRHVPEWLDRWIRDKVNDNLKGRHCM